MFCLWHSHHYHVTINNWWLVIWIPIWCRNHHLLSDISACGNYVNYLVNLWSTITETFFFKYCDSITVHGVPIFMGWISHEIWFPMDRKFPSHLYGRVVKSLNSRSNQKILFPLTMKNGTHQQKYLHRTLLASVTFSDHCVNFFKCHHQNINLEYTCRMTSAHFPVPQFWLTISCF